MYDDPTVHYISIISTSLSSILSPDIGVRHFFCLDYFILHLTNIEIRIGVLFWGEGKDLQESSQES